MKSVYMCNLFDKSTNTWHMWSLCWRFSEVLVFVLSSENQNYLGHKCDAKIYFWQGLVKGEKFCFRNLYFYIWHGESTSTASQLTSPASQKSRDLNKVLLLLQDLDFWTIFKYEVIFGFCFMGRASKICYYFFKCH